MKRAWWLVVPAAIGCGIGVQRDLSKMPAQAVVFDDACGLQEYFDTLASTTLRAPREVSSTDLEKTEGKRAAGGISRYSFETDFQVHHLRRVLQENWKRLPEEAMKAKAIDVEVRWAERAGTRRVVTDQDATLWVGKESWDLPYHACLSELLFGQEIYKTRRTLLALPPPPPSPWVKQPTLPDGGLAPPPDASIPDATPH